jgi:hypothetical protein
MEQLEPTARYKSTDTHTNTTTTQVYVALLPFGYFRGVGSPLPDWFLKYAKNSGVPLFTKGMHSTCSIYYLVVQ